ncbi:MAG TPA: ferredoxin [Polyangia bacterium]|nr:ferredoxin [Polyangia bacterium]
MTQPRSGSRLVVVVDWDRCEANGVCMRIAPDVFRVDEQDQLHVLVDAVSDERRAAVERAVAACPRQALSLVVK